MFEYYHVRFFQYFHVLVFNGISLKALLFVCITANAGMTANSDEIDQVKLLEAMKSYRPHSVRFLVA